MKSELALLLKALAFAAHKHRDQRRKEPMRRLTSITRSRSPMSSSTRAECAMSR